VNASTSWPDAIRPAPTRISALEPNRSSKQTGRHLGAGIHHDLKGLTNVDSTPGLAPKRSAASRPETPRVVAVENGDEVRE